MKRVIPSERLLRPIKPFGGGGNNEEKRGRDRKERTAEAESVMVGGGGTIWGGKSVGNLE